jgi:hypothetical protein
VALVLRIDELGEHFKRSADAEGRLDVECGWCGKQKARTVQKNARGWLNTHECKAAPPQRRGSRADIVVPRGVIVAHDADHPSGRRILGRPWRDYLTERPFAGHWRDMFNTPMIRTLARRRNARGARIALGADRDGTAIYAATPERLEQHFVGWADELDIASLFAGGRAWGIVKRRQARHATVLPFRARSSQPESLAA